MTTWQEVEKHWTEFKQKLHTHWPRITGAELNRIRGSRELLAKSLEADYQVTHLEAEKQIDSFLRTLAPARTETK